MAPLRVHRDSHSYRARDSGMSGRASLPDRVRRAFRLDHGQRRIEEETDAELRFHIERRIDALVAAGRKRGEDEAGGRGGFCSFDQSRAELLEAARSREEMLSMIDRIDGFQKDALYVTRQLRRSPGFTL